MLSLRKKIFASFAFWAAMGAILSLVQSQLLLEVQDFSGWFSKSFFVAAFFTHYYILAIPSALTFFLFSFFIKNGHLLSLIACLLAGFSVLFAWIDIYVYSLYGYHMDGMFLTLLLNPATSDSVEITLGTRLAIGIRVGILVASMPFVYFAMFRLLRWLRSRDSMPRGVTRFQAAFILAFAAVFLFEKSSFAYAWVERDLEITNVRSIMGPFYLAIAPDALMRDLGFEIDDRSGDPVMLPRGNVDNYPLNKIEVDESAPRPNIVILIIESAHTNIPAELIPNITELGAENISSENHFSGGNCTRFGFATVFYGLHPTYWHDLHAAHKAPVLFDLLRERGYRLNVFASNNLNFPEFRNTVFVNLQENEIKDAFPETMDIVDRDRITADRVLESIRAGDGAPFCTVAFWAASHYPYRYPKEFEKALPVMPIDEVDMITQGLVGDRETMDKIRNRSNNSISYIDSLVGETVAELKKKGLWENTILFVVGDHGQEFCDLGIGKGHMGHNGAFDGPQTRTLFAGHVPGTGKRRLERITSHYDIVPTILPQLGVKNPAGDYSDGVSLLEDSGRKYVLMAAWTEAALTDGQHVIKYGYGSHNMGCLNVYDENYRECRDPNAVSEMLKDIFADYMQDRCRFLKR